MKPSRMKFLKQLYYLLFILGLFCEPLQAKVIKIYVDPCYLIGQERFTQSEEINWLGLLYVKESYKLAATSFPSISILNFSLRENPNLVESWKVISNKPQLRMDILTLEAVSNLRRNLKFSTIGLTDDIISRIEGTIGLSYKETIINLDNLGKKVSEKSIELIDFNKVVSDMVEGGGKVDGANWITKYIGNRSDDFAGKRIKFEEFNSTELGGRYVDVSDVTDDGFKIFYEFKSVSKVPPGHFQTQFMKDLTAANDLGQIKWIFNGSKNPVGNSGEAFRTAMLAEIERLPLTDDLAKKFLQGVNGPTTAKLKQELVEKFDELFELAN